MALLNPSNDSPSSIDVMVKLNAINPSTGAGNTNFYKFVVVSAEDRQENINFF